MSIAPSPSIVTLPESAAGMHVLDFLAERFPRIETVVWRRRMAEDKVSWEDGSAVRPEALCRPGARIFYFREVEAEPVIPFAEEILFADDHLLVADKPPFLPVHPAGRWVNECLLHRLRRATGIEALAPLHRLDRDTSGLVLFSTNAETRPLYHRLFEDSAVERGYQAMARVTAAPRERDWWCRSRIVAGSPFFRMREAPGPPNATTRVVLASLGDRYGSFDLFPETGKKHQLRLHMAGLGFAIEGDRLYPELAPEAPDDFSRPLALLARRLAFDDPRTGERRRFVTHRDLPTPA